jgi:hypothetical protein
MLAAVHGATGHFLQDAKARLWLKIGGPDIKRLPDEGKYLPKSTLQACLFCGAYEHGLGGLELTCFKMVMRNVARRLASSPHARASSECHLRFRDQGIAATIFLSCAG